MSSICWFYADYPAEVNTSIHRILVPATIMRRAGHFCYWAHIDQILYNRISDESREAIDRADVIVLERLIIGKAHDFIKDMRDKGKLVVATFDDHYGLMPAGAGPAYDVWRGGKGALGGRGAILNEFRKGLSLCSKFIVPSKILLEDFRPYNDNAEFVPNYLLGDFWDNLPQKKDPDNIVIGWGGSSGHFTGWRESGLAPALGRICKKYPKVYVHLQTRDPRITEMLDKVGARYKAHGWVAFEDWPKIVSTFNIGVIPLSGEYDKRRSSLKSLENATAGVPWVATDDAPYADSRGGIKVPNKIGDWQRAIEDLLNDREFYGTLQEQGRAWARELNGQAVQTYERVFGISRAGG